MRESDVLVRYGLQGFVAFLPGVREDQAVIDSNYNPIVNLYAVGNSSGGKFSNHYSTPMQGLTLGIAMTLGRVLGKQLAEAPPTERDQPGVYLVGTDGGVPAATARL